jgi:purine-binding chemotaxis protein CheW
MSATLNGRALVTFVVADRLCALDLDVVERVEPMVAVTALAGAPAGVLGAVDVRGTITPVLDVRGRFGLPAAEPDPGASLLLARTSRRAVALPVDDVRGVVTVDPADVMAGEALELASSAGVARLPGGLLYIEDLERFLSPDEERRLAPALSDAAR